MLKGKKILVTGASGWIGEGIALALIAEGATVICHHRSQLPQSLEGQPEVRGDLTKVSDIERITAEVAKEFASIDGLVNNAAAQPVSPFLKTTEDEYDLVMAAGLKSAFFLTQRLAPFMPGGSVVNIASIEAEYTPPGHAHYGAAKAGLLSLTRTLAVEIAPVRVNAVLPGLIDRPGLAQDWPEGVARWLERAPSGRLGTREEVAAAVTYLLGAQGVTGASLRVDGGMGVRAW